MIAVNNLMKKSDWEETLQEFREKDPDKKFKCRRKSSKNRRP